MRNYIEYTNPYEVRINGKINVTGIFLSALLAVMIFSFFATPKGGGWMLVLLFVLRVAWSGSAFEDISEAFSKHFLKGCDFVESEDLHVWSNYGNHKATVPAIAVDVATVLCMITIMRHKGIIESTGTFVVTCLRAIYIVFGIICFLAAIAQIILDVFIYLVYSISIEGSEIYRLREHDFDFLCTQNPILLFNRSDIEKKDLWRFERFGDREDVSFGYLLDLDDIKTLYKAQNDESQIKASILNWCYLISTDDENELSQTLKDALEEYYEIQSTGVRTVFFVNFRNDSENRLQVPKEYQRKEFIRYIEVNSIDDINAQFILSYATKNVALTGEKNKSDLVYYFEKPKEFLTAINVDNQFGYSECNNEWLREFYINAGVFSNCSRAVMALLDYLELLLRIVYVYYYQKNAAVNENTDIMPPNKGNIFSLAQMIVNLSAIIPEKYNRFTTKRYIKSRFMDMYFEALEKIFYVRFEGDEISFLGILSLCKKIRDKFISHGSLKNTNSPIIWGLVYFGTTVVNEFLEVDKFVLKEDGENYLLGYGSDVVNSGRYIINYKGHPCIMSDVKSNIYIDYFSGELISPEYLEK